MTNSISVQGCRPKINSKLLPARPAYDGYVLKARGNFPSQERNAVRNSRIRIKGSPRTFKSAAGYALELALRTQAQKY